MCVLAKQKRVINSEVSSSRWPIFIPEVHSHILRSYMILCTDLPSLAQLMLKRGIDLKDKKKPVDFSNTSSILSHDTPQQSKALALPKKLWLQSTLFHAVQQADSNNASAKGMTRRAQQSTSARNAVDGTGRPCVPGQTSRRCGQRCRSLVVNSFGVVVRSVAHRQ